MVRKPVSSDPEQREKESERAREASKIGPSGKVAAAGRPRPARARQTPSNGGPEEESAHGALMREGIDSD